MKPELVPAETLEYLTEALQIVVDKFDKGDLYRMFPVLHGGRRVILKCRRSLFQIAVTPHKLNIFHMSDTMKDYDLLEIKRFLKFHTIAREMAKIYKDDGLPTILRETIYKIDYISYLHNMLTHWGLSGKEHTIHESLYESECRRHPKVVELILKLSCDYEPPSKFLASRISSKAQITSIKMLTDFKYMYDFMREMWVMPVRNILPLHELLKVSDSDSFGLRQDLKDLRKLLKKLVEIDHNTSLHIRGTRYEYKYVIATGKEQIQTIFGGESFVKLDAIDPKMELFRGLSLNSTFTGDDSQFPFKYIKGERADIEAMLKSFDFKVDVTDHPFSPSFKRDEYDLRPLFGE